MWASRRGKKKDGRLLVRPRAHLLSRAYAAKAIRLVLSPCSGPYTAEATVTGLSQPDHLQRRGREPPLLPCSYYVAVLQAGHACEEIVHSSLCIFCIAMRHPPSFHPLSSIHHPPSTIPSVRHPATAILCHPLFVAPSSGERLLITPSYLDGAE